ncbi:MAG: toprim domain-containing protein [Allomuricauda sp.]
MKNTISYKEDPEHYKRLIGKINREVDFVGYLLRTDHVLLKKSAGSMEFAKDGDRIVLMTSRDPISYFNRNDSGDKGLFFTFLRNREDNFYRTIEQGLEIIDRTHEHVPQSPKGAQNKGRTRSLEENYNITPLSNPIYLTRERGIATETLVSEPFRGRILNAFHHNDNGSKIANVAFPKFDIGGTPRNYILYNRPYRDRYTGEFKKFRLVLNRKDHFLFSSNPPKEGVGRIIFGESGIDLLSFHELKGKKGDLYISFGGNVYTEKLDFFYELITPFLSRKGVQLVSIFDNDATGHRFDVQVFTKLINAMAKGVYIENRINRERVSMNIHYHKDRRCQMAHDARTIEDSVGNAFPKGQGFKTILFSDKLALEFSIPESKSATILDPQMAKALRVFLTILGGLYLPVRAKIMKSMGKDWNEDLKSSKKERYERLGTVDTDRIRPGDKIVLKTKSGPEGAPNEGIVEEIRPTGVLANFGLRYTYMVPFQAIAAHLRPKKMSTKNITMNL